MDNPTVLFTIPLHRLKVEMQGWFKEILNQKDSELMKSKEGLILDTDQLMEKLGVTRPTLSKWRKEGRIPFIQVGSVVRYDLDKVLEVLENKKRRSK
ncbi:DNA binding domain-containing protein, excisionase family [Aquiflexum balticum DSM 16537]|uniref:DNA binding domain-containing protein, excisionase family n=1 Tax=Aquiflexum balticum DSM 16537 TaxID=758820 RepID=A0A1W2HCH5_9BACT|nr:helix-turn-helix domain-containing protein [Aquiflexum balticum]SMD46392.1 DNA binding domain-containing protein, excisionase family [Aquiflexum balticum DSM 16537]